MNTIQGYGIHSCHYNNNNLSFGATISRTAMMQLLSDKPKDEAYIMKLRRRLQELDLDVVIEGFMKLPEGSYVKLKQGKNTASANISYSNNKSYIDLMEELLAKNKYDTTKLEELVFMTFGI